ncbi:hypothetical protein GA0061098_100660 [Bradyrhizobium shewense]|uniref:Uncharacterized protein n=1 Tax=Bradyrhizobium shewense TaxID=1761772 RepID=A0A1C3VYT9_9BRAD|nr:hypothetical protein GA0061098_100660 [Bradyrhizobium shewense]
MTFGRAVCIRDSDRIGQTCVLFSKTEHNAAVSRQFLPESCIGHVALRCQRAQGRPGAGWHPRSTARILRDKKLHSGIQV